jgi:hypothetical protein
MSESCEPPPHRDVCLLLCAHAEQGWLRREVLPVLLQIEGRRVLAPEQLAAALAYLEVAWAEAQLRARETDATSARLRRVDDRLFVCQRARRYSASVRALRERIATRVSLLIACPLAASPDARD